MICGFLNNKTISAEEYLIAYGLRTGNHADVNYDLLNMSIKFDGNEVDAFIIDIADDKLILQLVLPRAEWFDNKSNVYKTSYVRKLLNSDDFLSRFNQEFVECIKPTKVHTENYTTIDKLWLLSHEEINQHADFLEANHNCRLFDLFKHIDLQSYSQTLLKLNNQDCYAWRVRSACSYNAAMYNSKFVGYVNIGGNVNYGSAGSTYIGALCPACTIC